jgi:hypothetical protein
MSLSAYKTIRDTHEDRQDERLLALETTGASDEARILAIESKTQHMEPQPDHSRHGRRLQATDRITVDSVADEADAILDARCYGAAPAQAALKLEFGAANEAGRIICDTDELRAEVQSASTTRTAWTVQRTSGLTKFHNTTEVRRQVGEGDAELRVLAYDAAGDAELTIETDAGRSANKKRLRIRAAVSGDAEYECDPGLTQHTFLDDIQIKETNPHLYLTDIDHNPDWSVGNANGVFRIRDETAGRNVVSANNAGDVNVGISTSTTAVLGALLCQGNATLAGSQVAMAGTLKVNDLIPESGAHITIKDATTVSVGQGSTLSTSNGHVALDVQGFSQQGLGLPVIATAGADAMCLNAPRNGVACYDSGRDRLVFKGSGTAARVVADSGTSQVAWLQINHNMALRSGPVTGFAGSTTAWTTLSASADYPTLTITVATNDILRVGGQFVEDHSSYDTIGDHFRLVVRRGGPTGALISNLDASHVLSATGGDNNQETCSLTWPTTSHLITSADAGTVWVGWEIKRRSASGTVTLVAESQQVSTVHIEHLRRCVVPTV